MSPYGRSDGEGVNALSFHLTLSVILGSPRVWPGEPNGINLSMVVAVSSYWAVADSQPIRQTQYPPRDVLVNQLAARGCGPFETRRAPVDTDSKIPTRCAELQHIRIRTD